MEVALRMSFWKEEVQSAVSHLHIVLVRAGWMACLVQQQGEVTKAISNGLWRGA